MITEFATVLEGCVTGGFVFLLLVMGLGKK